MCTRTSTLSARLTPPDANLGCAPVGHARTGSPRRAVIRTVRELGAGSAEVRRCSRHASYGADDALGNTNRVSIAYAIRYKSARRGAQTPALLRRRRRGAPLRPRRRAPAHRAAAALAADPPASRPSSASRCCTARRAASSSRPPARCCSSAAREILAAVDAAVEDARRAARGEYGRLAIGFTGSSTYALLPALAAALREALPGVVLDLRGELLTPAQVARLLDGTLDLGLLRPPVHERELCTRGAPLASRSSPCSRRRTRSPAADAVPLEELEDEPFVTYPSHFRSVVHDAVEDACAAHGFKPRRRARGRPRPRRS